jgi:hypothetical protein
MPFSNALITCNKSSYPICWCQQQGTSLLQMHCCCHLSCGIHIPYTTVCCFWPWILNEQSVFFLSTNKPEWFLVSTRNPSNLLTYNSNSHPPPVCLFLVLTRTCSPCGVRTAEQRRQSSCYLQGPSWVDLSTCFLIVWLLFSGGGLASGNGKLLAPSTDGPDTTWFSWSGSCLGATSDALDECPLLTNRQRHGSDLDDSGELGGLITMLDSGGGGGGGGGAVCSLSGLSSTSSEILQTGQVEFCSSHKSIQAVWKLWLQ